MVADIFTTKARAAIASGNITRGAMDVVFFVSSIEQEFYERAKLHGMSSSYWTDRNGGATQKILLTRITQVDTDEGGAKKNKYQKR